MQRLLHRVPQHDGPAEERRANPGVPARRLRGVRQGGAGQDIRGALQEDHEVQDGGGRAGGRRDDGGIQVNEVKKLHSLCSDAESGKRHLLIECRKKIAVNWLSIMST